MDATSSSPRVTARLPVTARTTRSRIPGIIAVGIWLALLTATHPFDPSCLDAWAAEVSVPADGDSLRGLMDRAGAGEPEAQYQLGRLYESGAGVPQDDSLAASWLSRAAQQDHLEAEVSLAGLYMSGRGVRRDSTEAARRFRHAAERGHPWAQFWMTASFFRAWKSTGDSTAIAEALRWLRAACDQGLPVAEFSLGSMYRSGDGVPEDSAQAIRWLTAAADHHFRAAQSMLATMYCTQDWVPAQRAEALEWFREAAEDGDPIAQFALAWLLSQRTIVLGMVLPEADAPGTPDLAGAYMWSRIASDPGDLELGSSAFPVNPQMLMMALELDLSAEDLADAKRRALDWLERHPDFPPGREQVAMSDELVREHADLKAKAERGDAEAQLELGIRYHNGMGTPRSNREAARWARLAADQGLARAQVAMGDLCLRGEGVTQSDAEAASWYRKAAKGGDPIGQEQLARLYSGGDGVAQDDRQALEWALKSAEQGLASGQYLAGFLLCCKLPSSVPTDKVAAYAWFTLAAEGGYEGARLFLATLGDGMTPKELADAGRRATEWRERNPRRAQD
jgi:hypothetical protein